MEYIILALFLPVQMHSSLDKTAIYFLVVMTSLDATQTDDFIRHFCLSIAVLSLFDF